VRIESTFSTHKLILTDKCHKCTAKNIKKEEKSKITHCKANTAT
jgi:hypothetical protein